MTTMRTARRIVIRAQPARAVLLGLLMVSAARADQQPRSSGTLAPAAGTSRISGVVVDAQSRPVRSAIVTLTGTELPTGRAAITDDTGRFSFDRLPAGRYSLASSKPAYLKATYGAVRPGGTGTPITLGASEQLTDLTLTMPHGGAIAGTVRDLKGAPLAGVQVSVSRVGAAVTPPLRADGVYTDDRGAYRVFGLLPGTYYVIASTLSSGGLGEVGIMSTTQVDATLARLKQRTASTATATTAQKPVPDSSPSSIVRPTETYSSTPILAPGATSAAEATPVVLGLGEERAGIDIVFQLARAAAVRGTVSGSGPGDNVQISMATEGVSVPMPMMLGVGPMLQPRQRNGDGEFVFTNVTPGKYTLLARTSAVPAGGRAGLPSAPAVAGGAPVLFATTTLDVRGEDVSGIALTLQPALHVRGRVNIQPTTAAPPDLTKMRISLSPAGRITGAAMSPNGLPLPTVLSAGIVRQDGTFDLAGVISGSYRITAIGAPAGWLATSATLAGIDLLDQALEIGSSDVAGIEIALSDQHSQLAGRLLQANGAPASGYFVVVFSADRAHWQPQARRLRSVRPSTDGQFRVDDLPAGDYYVAALTDADSDEWQSADFLTQVVLSAVKVTIGAGEKKTQDLRINR